MGRNVDRVFTVVAAVLALLATASFFGNLLTFGGDPEIHLVFAKNMLAGHPLQFNAGVYSSGETSPLYMTILASIIGLFGQTSASISMKLLGVGSALGLLYLTFREARRAFERSYVAVVAPLCLAAAPFFFFQAELGMENMPFALALAIVLKLATDRPSSVGRFVALSFAAHALFYLRPEAIFLVAFLYSDALFDSRVRARKLAVSVVLTVALAVSILAIERLTGVPLHGAGVVRAIASRRASFHVPATPLYLNRAPLLFLAYAWPLVLALAVHRRRIPRALAAAVVCFDLVPFVLHTLNVLPNTHFTRYSLYWWFPLVLVGMRVMSTLDARAKAWPAYALLANTLVVSGAEVALRIRAHSFANTNFSSTLATARDGAVKARSDDYCARLDCSRLPIVLAVQEVQLRLRLDDRFVVASLDGIVDGSMRNYMSVDGAIDALGYVHDRHVDYVLEYPDSGNGDDPRSLFHVYEDAARGPVEIGCDVFTRLTFDDANLSDALQVRERKDCH